MAGGVRKLGVGDQVKIAAKDYNRWQDAGMAHAFARFNQADGRLNPDAQEGIILVKNTTALSLPRFSILGLNGSVYDPNYSEQQRSEFKNQIALKGEMPSSTYAGKFCVLQNDALPGEVVPAMVSGVTPCLLNVGSTADTHADVETNLAVDRTRYLKTGVSGAAQILFKPLGLLGEQLGVVRLSNRQTPETGLIHFELGGTLVLREVPDSVARHAPAVILEWDGNSWEPTGEQIEVYDWFGEEGMWNGIAGYRGWARKHIERPASSDENGGRQAYEIVWMERKAQLIRFTSTQYMGEGGPGMNVTVDTTPVNGFDWQGKEPAPTVRVYDPKGLFQDAPSGAAGFAYYNNRAEQYEVFECERLAKFAVATLTADMCGSTATFDTFSEYPVGEFKKPPATLPTTASNTFAHAGVIGDKVALRRINNTMPAPTWQIVDVTKHEKVVMVDVRVDGFTLQKKELTIYTEVCTTTAPSWTTWHTGDDCTE